MALTEDQKIVTREMITVLYNQLEDEDGIPFITWDEFYQMFEIALQSQSVLNKVKDKAELISTYFQIVSDTVGIKKNEYDAIIAACDAVVSIEKQ